MSKIVVCTYDSAFLPVKGTEGSICWDLCSSEDFSVEPHKIVLLGSGVKTALPDGWGARIYARSSLPTKMGLMLANGVAVIDSDYRGEYRLQFYNRTNETVSVEKGTRLAQVEFFSNVSKDFPEIEMHVDAKMYDDFDQLFSTVRGSGGIGSTGN